MEDLTSRKEEYEGLKKEKIEKKKKEKDERSELANFIALFRIKEAVLYKGKNNWLVIVKECDSCVYENIGIMCSFLAGLSKSAKRSTSDMENFNKEQIYLLLEFIRDSDTKIANVVSLDRLGVDSRWEPDIYKQYFE